MTATLALPDPRPRSAPRWRWRWRPATRPTPSPWPPSAAPSTSTPKPDASFVTAADTAVERPSGSASAPASRTTGWSARSTASRSRAAAGAGSSTPSTAPTTTCAACRSSPRCWASRSTGRWWWASSARRPSTVAGSPGRAAAPGRRTSCRAAGTVRRRCPSGSPTWRTRRAASVVYSSLPSSRPAAWRRASWTCSGSVWRDRGLGDFYGYVLVAEGAAEVMVEAELQGLGPGRAARRAGARRRPPDRPDGRSGHAGAWRAGHATAASTTGSWHAWRGGRPGAEPEGPVLRSRPMSDPFRGPSPGRAVRCPGPPGRRPQRRPARAPPGPPAACAPDAPGQPVVPPPPVAGLRPSRPWRRPPSRSRSSPTRCASRGSPRPTPTASRPHRRRPGHPGGRLRLPRGSVGRRQVHAHQAARPRREGDERPRRGGRLRPGPHAPQGGAPAAAPDRHRLPGLPAAAAQDGLRERRLRARGDRHAARLVEPTVDRRWRWWASPSRRASDPTSSRVARCSAPPSRGPWSTTRA